jgi:glycosyltransferase involved in cell wall biosynthesis
VTPAKAREEARPPVKTTHLPPPGGVAPQVFLISQTPYNYLHHRFQQIANRLVDWQLPVVYVQESSGWRPYLSGVRKGFSRALLRSIGYHLLALFSLLTGLLRAKPAGPHPEPEPGRLIVIEMPLGIPTVHFNWSTLEMLSAAIYRQVLRRAVFPRMSVHRATVALVNSPIWGNVLLKGDFDRIIYDCIDDVALYAGKSSIERFRGYERKLLDLSHGVVVTAAPLEEQILELVPEKPVTRIPNGVDVEWFQASAAEATVPTDLPRTSRPLIGYIGSISTWLDLELSRAVAESMPDAEFLFIGPADPWLDLEALARLPNVRFLGRKPYEEVPSYVAACRVCWIPFSSGRIVEHTNPIKLFEYFALGKPVVSTPMPELGSYARNDLVRIGSSPEEIRKALRAALQEQDGPLGAERVAVARAHGWEALIRQLYGVLRGERDA